MKFSIRDLFLVTMIVALAVGWWVDHRRQAATVKQSEVAAKEAEKTASSWQGTAKALARIMKDDGWNVEVTEGGYGATRLPASQAPAPIPPKK